MKKEPQQKAAMERLRGNPQPDIAVSDAAWKRLQRAIAEALAWRDMTRGVSVEDLQAIFAGQTAGINCNGWSNPYPKDDPRSLMKQYQFQSYHDPAQFVLDLWSRQTGKDFTSALVAGSETFAQPKTQWTIAAPSERQSLESLEKVKDVVLAHGDFIADYQEDRESTEALIKSAMITLRNGSRIRAVPGMPHTVRGLTSNVILTEGDFFEKPKETMRALLGSLANEESGRKRLRLITTPNGKEGMAFKIWSDAGSLYSKRLISIWRAVCLGIKQNPAILEKALADPEGWAQEFLCEFLDGASVLLPYELLATVESTEASEFDTPEILAASPLSKIGGIDFGRVNDPTVMVTALRGLGMKIVRNITRLHGMSTPDQITTLSPYIELCDCVEVDYTGPGVGFGDLAVEQWGLYDPENHEFGKIALKNFTVPFKRRIFPQLRTSMERRQTLIPISAKLREDCHAYQQVITNGQYNYKAPRSDEGHSDECTALALMVDADAICQGGPVSAVTVGRHAAAGAGAMGQDNGRRMGRAGGL